MKSFKNPRQEVNKFCTRSKLYCGLSKIRLKKEEEVWYEALNQTNFY
jgi:hypothetical protein